VARGSALPLPPTSSNCPALGRAIPGTLHRRPTIIALSIVAPPSSARARAHAPTPDILPPRPSIGDCSHSLCIVPSPPSTTPCVDAYPYPRPCDAHGHSTPSPRRALRSPDASSGLAIRGRRGETSFRGPWRAGAQARPVSLHGGASAVAHGWRGVLGHGASAGDRAMAALAPSPSPGGGAASSPGEGGLCTDAALGLRHGGGALPHRSPGASRRGAGEAHQFVILFSPPSFFDKVIFFFIQVKQSRWSTILLA
jgi:hypothetical protein